MSHPLTTGALPPETVAMLVAVVSDKVQNNECFFAIDVSNEVKMQGIKAATPTGFGKHTDMQKVIFDNMVQFMASGMYACTDFPYSVAFDIPPRRLYHPLNTPFAVIDAHENRRVIALPPVEVLMAQKSTQATGTQTMAADAYPAARITDTFLAQKAAAQDAAGMVDDGTKKPVDGKADAGMATVFKDGAPTTLGAHILKQLGNGQ
jgi:hypothetical protein